MTNKKPVVPNDAENDKTNEDLPETTNNKANENLPEATNELLKVLIGEMRENNQIHNRDMGKVKDELQKANKRIDGIETKFIENQRLEEWQMDTIKDFTYTLVKNSISKKSYANDSLRSIAYRMAYGKLKKYGYAPSGRTKQKNYETLSNAMSSGTITLSEKEVLERYDYNQWKKQKDLGAQI